ncbi:MAG: ABC transporter permease [Marinovum algicola]|jgi:ABC-type polysaccharide/polyol phosphate export permease|uniref:ABC-type polysaccharide/polyol phosphate export permease n=1 Tax=Marinovum algicola TaxID=42444 RepID=A0A975W8X6_9RHOB|nr:MULTISPECIES: ABC transporter permease [Marinovum]AKO98324.1 ABC-type polysaccharide/polyol phosphate export system, permease component [Marinovum algicola DG 898]MDD9740568.1 ABC transporter permease [Marinovum sp. SP66]MDD9746028.1 ABC transporter permease [Marinovum sp. PR37]SEJ22458.1 ABC-type polysaccharide/polyol phosphate export permease [Marinovum algicola]SLN48582.1 ABC-2 type transporter [Marinovum algicola]
MFVQRRPRTTLDSVVTTIELVYHGAVRNVRKTHGNAFMSIFMNVLQTIIMVMVFYAMFTVLGLRGLKLRGDFLIYIMSGIFLYMTHIKTMSAVAGAEGPTAPMMQHAPMNTIISILSGMLSSLYIQVLSVLIVLFVYDVGFADVEINDPIGCMGMILLAWFTGAAVGMVFLALKPWFPSAITILSSIYQRANMIASGKMFVANTLPGYMLAMFDWNPLFHAIDQARGYAFVNYYPRNSNLEYPLWLGVGLITIGLMGEFYTRRHASASWSARS